MGCIGAIGRNEMQQAVNAVAETLREMGIATHEHANRRRHPGHEGPPCAPVGNRRARSRSPCSDIDGILRGKYLHKDKFFGAASRTRRRLRLLRRGLRLGLVATCATTTPGHRLAARLSRRAGAAGPGHRAPRALGRRRALLPGRVRQCRRHALPGVPAPDAEARAEARREAGLRCRWPAWSSSGSTSTRRPTAGPPRRAWARRTMTPGMFGYSLLRMNDNREFFNALMDEMAAFGVPIEGLHTETGPGVYEAAIAFSERAGAGRPRHPVQDRRQGDRQALRHHAQLHGQVEPGLPGLQRPHPPEPVRRQEQPVLRREEPARA